MTITIPDELAASLQLEADRQGTTAESLALQGVRSVVTSPEADRGYELDDEMNALLAAKRERIIAEASRPPQDVGHFADDNWDSP